MSAYMNPLSRKCAILKVINAHPGISSTDFMGAHGYHFNFATLPACQRELQRLVKDGWLIHCDKLLKLTDAAVHAIKNDAHDEDLVEEAGPRVEPPYHPEFKTLSAKYIPSGQANRPDADPRPEHSIFISGTSPCYEVWK